MLSGIRSLLRPRRLMLTGAGVLLVAALLGVFVLLRGSPGLEVPPDITAKAAYPIYLPRQLPGTYTVDPKRLTLIENGGVAFSDTDNTNTPIAFTEQKRPKNINFNEFYHQNIKDGKILDNMTHATFVGKTFDNKTNVVSVVTDETWIMATT